MKILRASKAGFPCMRNLWYSVNGDYESEIDPHSQRIFDVGNALEPMVIKWLREDGWTVEYNPGSQSADLELRVPINGGELVGHPDAFMGNASDILIDIKTMNDRAFRYWKQEGTLKKYPQYAIQLHIYAMGATIMGRFIDRLGIVGVNKNTSEMHIDFFDYNPEISVEIVERAKKLFAMDEAPIEDSPAENWCCGYCEYSKMCELHQKKEIPIGEGIITTEDQEIIGAMELLREARNMSKEASELEDSAKEILNNKVKDVGIKSVRGGDLILTLKESVSNRFDTKAFKKMHSEMAIEFTKPVRSVTYELKVSDS